MEDGRNDGDEDQGLGPVATRLLFEDEDVRIWDQQLAPGEATAPHHHALDYALVEVEGDAIHVAPVAGGANPHGIPNEGVALPASGRGVHFVPRGSTERATNVGSRRYRAILVEYKRGTP